MTLNTFPLPRGAGSTDDGAVEHIVDDVCVVVVPTAVGFIEGFLHLQPSTHLGTCQYHTPGDKALPHQK